jgi:hypothetical protein
MDKDPYISCSLDTLKLSALDLSRNTSTCRSGILYSEAPGHILSPFSLLSTNLDSKVSTFYAGDNLTPATVMEREPKLESDISGSRGPVLNFLASLLLNI